MKTATDAVLRSGAAPPEQKGHRFQGPETVLRYRRTARPRNPGKGGTPCVSSA